LESDSFELFFEYVELPNFDIASDALSTFKVNPYLHILLCVHFLFIRYWMLVLDKMFAGFAYQTWNCCLWVFGLPLPAGHCLVLKVLCIHVINEMSFFRECNKISFCWVYIWKAIISCWIITSLTLPYYYCNTPKHWNLVVACLMPLQKLFCNRVKT
jgi:hypothetical protein